MTTILLKDAVSVDSSRRSVSLPKVCSWFMSDFAPRKAYTSASIDDDESMQNDGNVVPLPIYCLTSILPYLEGQNKNALNKLVVEATSPGLRQTHSKVNVKYNAFQFRSRIFEQSPLSLAYHTEIADV